MSDNASSGPVEIGAHINSALEDGLPMVVAYVDAEGTPQLSLRGSTHTHGPGELAFWARKAEGGVVEAIANNPNVTLMYRDPSTRTTLYFYGKAHKARRLVNQDRIYNESPERERNADPERKGTGIAVVLDLVLGRTRDGAINLGHG